MDSDKQKLTFKEFIVKTGRYLLSKRKQILVLFLLYIPVPILQFLTARGNFASEVYAPYIAKPIAFILSRITSIAQFSVTEFLIAFLVVFSISSLVIAIVSFCKKNWQRGFKKLYQIVCICLVVLLSFNLLFTGLYKRQNLSSALEIEYPEMNLQLAYDASEYYSTEINAIVDNLERDEKGNVLCPYTFFELVGKINEEFSKIDNPYLYDFEIKAKPMLFSRVVSYLGFSGFIFPMTFEANINTDTPSYQLPKTIAHELAHGKSVMPENEANYLAVYVLLNSDDDYLRYSALMTAQSTMLSECYDQNDTSFYYAARELVDERCFIEYSNANELWSSFDTFIDKITNYLNDRYLKSSGLPSGVKSYSETAEFYTALYLKATERSS